MTTTTTTTTTCKMKAAVATGFGPINDNVEIRTDWPKPQLGTKVATDSNDTSENSKEGKTAADNKDNNNDDDNELLLIKVLACALAPGDVRVLSGKTDYFQLPAGGRPYVIGSDVSGIVEQVPEGCTKFQKGDYVVARFDEPKPNGGLGEYRLVKQILTEKCPDDISPIHACGLPASAMAAKRVVRDYVKSGDRVLIIGGSGGVGSSMLQYAKHVYGASFVAAVSTQTEQCKQLGADQVIDYRTTKWWQVPEFQSNKFNVVIDLVNGENWVIGGNAGTAVHPSGVYVALLSGVDTEIEAYGMLDVVKIIWGFKTRKLWAKWNPKLPEWVTPEALKLEDGDLKELFQDIVEGKLKPILDPSSPFEFTEQGVRDAMALQKSKHAHGKVVVEISKKE